MAREDDVGSDHFQRARERVRRGEGVRTGELAARKQIAAVGPAEHGVADNVGGALRTHRKDMNRGAFGAVFQRERHFERIEILRIEDGRQRRAVDRPFGGHRILTHIAGIGHLLGQYDNFKCFFHKVIVTKLNRFRCFGRRGRRKTPRTGPHIRPQYGMRDTFGAAYAACDMRRPKDSPTGRSFRRGRDRRR